MLEPLALEQERRQYLSARVYASIGELRLSDVQIKLERPLEDRQDFSLSQLLQAPAMSLESLPGALHTAMAVALPVVLFFLLLWFRRQLLRHQRRRHLKARIRRMKKKMES